jgi:hypothetical protein
MAFSDYSATAADNTTIAGIGIAENCSPANINNAIRALMADAKTFADDLGDGTDYQPLDASLTALAALVTAANKGLYFTASDTPATYDLTSYGRTLAGLADAAALRSNIGAVTITASSLAASGYITINISSVDLIIQWGTGTLGSAVSFPANFATACWSVVYSLAGNIGQSDEADEIHYLSAVSSTQFTTSVSGDYSSLPSIYWIAIGK